jgi:hypothetical protein
MAQVQAIDLLFGAFGHTPSHDVTGATWILDPIG